MKKNIFKLFACLCVALLFASCGKETEDNARETAADLRPTKSEAAVTLKISRNTETKLRGVADESGELIWPQEYDDIKIISPYVILQKGKARAAKYSLYNVKKPIYTDEALIKFDSDDNGYSFVMVYRGNTTDPAIYWFLDEQEEVTMPEKLEFSRVVNGMVLYCFAKDGKMLYGLKDRKNKEIFSPSEDQIVIVSDAIFKGNSSRGDVYNFKGKKQRKMTSDEAMRMF